MNAIVVYSSQTGRTKQIAQAVVSGLPEGTPCVSVDEMPKDLSGYDCVFVGFWSDKDQADPKGQEALRQIKNDNVAVFATLHDDPYSDQASKHLRGGPLHRARHVPARLPWRVPWPRPRSCGASSACLPGSS